MGRPIPTYVMVWACSLTYTFHRQADGARLTPPHTHTHGYDGLRVERLWEACMGAWGRGLLGECLCGFVYVDESLLVPEVVH